MDATGMITGARTLLAVAMAVCLTLAAAVPVRAQDSSDVFTVAPIPVDVTASSASAARGRAMADGQLAAFGKLVERIVPAGDRGAVPPLSPAEAQNFVQSIEVIRERASDVRYVADLRVAFNRGAVRDLLLRAGVRFAETRSRPVLLVPVYAAEGRTVLWEDTNGWAQSWQTVPLVQGLVPIVLPYGDLADIQDLDLEQALAPDVDRLLTMAGRYGARDAVVAFARMATDVGPLEVRISRHGEAGSDELLPVSVAAAPDAGPGPVLAEGVMQVAARINDDWMEANLVRPGVETRVSVIVPVLGLDQWIDVRRKLDSIAILSRRDLMSFGRAEARLDLWINGDEQQLRTALAQRDLELVDNVDGTLLKRTTDPLPDAYLQSPGGYAPAGSAPPSVPGAASPARPTGAIPAVQGGTGVPPRPN